MRRLRILTWHVHGSYLYYLGHAPHDFYVPVRAGRPPGYTGLPAGPYPWSENLHEVPVEDVPRLALDCILYQAPRHYLEDRHVVLSPAQARLPAVYLEHDPPREHPTDTRHVVNDPSVLLVHVTAFNALMWDSGLTSTTVIEHGVSVPADVRYSGELPRAIAVVNNLRARGRRLGADVLAAAQAQVPVDLVGLDAVAAGGLGEVPHDRLSAFEARYRVFFNPIRYTSLGLAVCEAMMLGLPVVGLATTEMVSVVKNGVTGYVDTRVEAVVAALRALLDDPGEARRIGAAARRLALERFSIRRFARDWDRVLREVAGRSSPTVAGSPASGRPTEVPA
jgi:glycosyltransferase involved in cell wall biosynthesis